MIGGNTTSNTNCGANGTVGKPGIRARTTPVTTRRMAGGIASRAAMTATAAITTSSTTRVWIIAVISAVVSDDGLYGSGECRRPQARPSACPLPKGSLPETLVLCLTDLLRGGHPATGLGIGGLFFALERELVVSVRGESGVNRLNDHRSLSDCRGDPLHRPGADISNGEDAG